MIFELAHFFEEALLLRLYSSVLFDLPCRLPTKSIDINLYKFWAKLYYLKSLIFYFN